ncbi:hypothetical protein R6Q59_001827 [Mikania micrantha]
MIWDITCLNLQTLNTSGHFAKEFLEPLYFFVIFGGKILSKGLTCSPSKLVNNVMNIVGKEIDVTGRLKMMDSTFSTITQTGLKSLIGKTEHLLFLKYVLFRTL